MKRTLCVLLSGIMLLSMLTACSQEPEKPPVLEKDEISSMTNDVAIENAEASIVNRETDMSDKAIEMEKDVTLVSEELYRDAYYGVPVKLGDKYYNVPAVKILNYYFIDEAAVEQITGLNFIATEEGIEVIEPEKIDINIEGLSEGSVSAEAINIDDIKLVSDEEKLLIQYKNKTYISLITLKQYMKDSKFYVDRTIGAITTTKPDISHPTVNNNGLLRKSVNIDDEREIIVREGSLGKMLVVYDIYGSSLDITPNDITFATSLQNLFLHKTEDTIYMFGLMGHSVEVYTIDIDEELNINITAIGGVQRPAQNIYFINGEYVAIGRNDIFIIEFDEENIYEKNINPIIEMVECGGDFNIVNGEYYLPVKNQFGEIVIYKLDTETFTTSKVKTLELDIEFDKANENFYYTFVEDNMISIYLMDNTGYIYNVLYDFETDATSSEQTDTFRLFYSEETFPVEFAINLVKSNETGDSDLSLTVNNVYLGNNVIIYGIEDNWVYCSEYIKSGENYSIYSFRYNAITGIRDYSNLA